MMVKRIGFYIALFVVSIVCVVLIIMIIGKYKTPEVQSFDAGEYQCFVEDFPSEDNIGPISDSKDLLEKVETIWIEKYGERVKKQKPYHVFYDEKNGIWLLQGTLHFYAMGGVANILVENDTGKILAVWHEK